MTNTVPTSAQRSFLDAAAVAAASRSAADARTLLGVARAFVAWTQHNGVNPVAPTKAQVVRFTEERGYKSANKVRWAIRAALRACGSLSDEHGLGTGASLAEFDLLLVSTGAAVHAFLDTVPRRQAVWRSGMRKLVRWCAEMEIDPLELSPPDLDDYRDWIRRVGGKEGELLVIARRFLAFRYQT